MKRENKEVFVDTKTLRECSTDELQMALKEAREPLSTRTKPDYPKPHLVKGYRKLIARIETILRERQLRKG